MTLISGLIWGEAGTRAALLFGAVATGVQLLAHRLVRRLGIPASIDRLKIYLIGTLLRFGGVVLMGAMSAWREGFSLPAAALGYLGVLLPLLFLETQLDR